MRYDWNKIINRNIGYSECQLITAINAAYLLTGKEIEQESDEYEMLVDLVKARYGSALCVEEAWAYLGIKSTKKFTGHEIRENTSAQIPLPLEMSIWHKRTGFHSTLVLDHDLKTNCIRVANFREVTSTDGWMFIEDIHMYLYDNPEKVTPHRANFALFEKC